MNGQEASKQTFGAKLCKVISAPIRYFYSLMAALATSLTIGMTTYCEKIKKDMDADTIFSNMAEIVIKIAFYVGALITIGGIFSLILAYKDDNADGQTRAVRLIVVGVVLIGFRTVLSIAGII